MAKFLLKLLIFCSPFFILVFVYIIADPFCVLRYKTNPYQGCVIEPQRDNISVSTFDNNNATYNYNSFILGNSRSLFWEIDFWKKYLPSSASCYHFDASGEDLIGSFLKLRYIEKSGNQIDDVLLVIDNSSFNLNANQHSLLSKRPPQIDSTISRFDFQLSFLLAFIDPDFFIPYLDYMIFKTERKYMKSVIDIRQFDYVNQTNELKLTFYEKMIETSFEKYYNANKMKLFYARDSVQKMSAPVIKSEHKNLLIKIKQLFARNKTRYKIAISPLYNQIKFSNQDLTQLYHIFGKENVFDFSGINEYTSVYSNYYENSHYRPFISSKLLEKIYEK